MFYFFRRLRDGLLEGNRLSGYSLYALGEPILVVLGILNDLQINEWNEERKRGQERLELYRALKNDFMTTQGL